MDNVIESYKWSRVYGSITNSGYV